jgi:flagellar motor switch protein FliG
MLRHLGIVPTEKLDPCPIRAFCAGPVTRVGAILNYFSATLRNDVLDGPDVEDAEFAEQIRNAIFTFANIKDCVASRDIPHIQRDLGQAGLLSTIAGAESEDIATIDFIMENISQRLAKSIRVEAAEKQGVSTADAEAAIMRIVNVARALESSGEIFLVAKYEWRTPLVPPPRDFYLAIA